MSGDRDGDSMYSIRLSNYSGRELIAYSYSITDTIQLVAHDTVKLTSSDRNSEYLLMVPDEYFYLHLHKPGLFGLTSPRTKLTTGYGYRLKSSELYVVQTSSESDNGLSIAALNADGEFESIDTITKYKFGDMFIKPALKHIGVIPNIPDLKFTTSMFRDQQSKTLSTAASSSGTSDDDSTVFSSLPAPSEVAEDEVWGMFFQRVFQAGVWAHTANFITKDDLEGQEPYLFIGLPALTLYLAVERSIDDPDGLIFFDGRRMITETCPNNFKVFFDMLISSKLSLKSIMPMSEEEKSWTRQFLLYSSSDKSIIGIIIIMYIQNTFYITFSITL